MIHVATNPDEPQDDWITICNMRSLSPALQYNEIVQNVEVAKARREEGSVVCGDCLSDYQAEEVEDGS